MFVVFDSVSSLQHAKATKEKTDTRITLYAPIEQPQGYHQSGNLVIEERTRIKLRVENNFFAFIINLFENSSTKIKIKQTRVTLALVYSSKYYGKAFPSHAFIIATF